MQATTEKRRRFFANIDNQEIRQSRLGMPRTPRPKIEWESTIADGEWGSGPEDAPTKDDLSDVNEAFENIDLVPLK